MGLCTILERGAHAEPRLMPVRERKPARRDARPALARAAAAQRHADRPRARGGGRRRDEHAASVEAWARDVWAAWQPHHETVRGWLDRAAPREC